MKLLLINLVFLLSFYSDSEKWQDYYPVKDGFTNRYIYGDEEVEIKFYKTETKKDCYHRCFCRKKSDGTFVPVDCDSVKVCGKQLKYIYNAEEILMFPKYIKVGDTLDVATEICFVSDYFDKFELNGKEFESVFELTSLNQYRSQKSLYAKHLGIIYLKDIYGKEMIIVDH